MKLEILISTIDAGIDRTKHLLLPFRSDIKYIITHQYTDRKYISLPKELIRKDVKITQLYGKGLSISRNNCIKHATGEICVIADDDVRYTYEYFDKILEMYQKNDTDIACFKIFTGQGQPMYKNYPKKAVKVTDLKTYWPSSIEITFKLKPILEKKLLFDARFGLGAIFCGGEESLFIMDAIQKGCLIKFFPDYIVEHPTESSVKSLPVYSRRIACMLGAMDAKLHGYFSIIKAFCITVRILPDLLRCRKNPLTYLFQRILGGYYILKNGK